MEPVPAFEQWGELPPEMQNEVAAQLDVCSRAALRLTSKAALEQWPALPLTPFLVGSSGHGNYQLPLWDRYYRQCDGIERNAEMEQFLAGVAVNGDRISYSRFVKSISGWSPQSHNYFIKAGRCDAIALAYTPPSQWTELFTFTGRLARFARKNMAVWLGYLVTNPNFDAALWQRADAMVFKGLPMAKRKRALLYLLEYMLLKRDSRALLLSFKHEFPMDFDGILFVECIRDYIGVSNIKNSMPQFIQNMAVVMDFYASQQHLQTAIIRILWGVVRVLECHELAMLLKSYPPLTLPWRHIMMH